MVPISLVYSHIEDVCIVPILVTRSKPLEYFWLNYNYGWWIFWEKTDASKCASEIFEECKNNLSMTVTPSQKKKKIPREMLTYTFENYYHLNNIKIYEFVIINKHSTFNTYTNKNK